MRYSDCIPFNPTTIRFLDLKFQSDYLPIWNHIAGARTELNPGSAKSRQDLLRPRSTCRPETPTAPFTRTELFEPRLRACMLVFLSDFALMKKISRYIFRNTEGRRVG